ncbi:MAG: ABC transporter permease [Saprospiraceae bacterium]|nr:ABC transporter permease [Candidatus Vicinibacter affinis]MBP6174133.1 ABC transporter permease [Saprospiraceae bacterium]MBK6572309.1 ABC transporter permease [Candidatus Vicinibacter affinis]MBK6824286.1 ABC transporter permease [Candidatus Vicinibacter affinis]MBK7799106.1 ABC transporter permease [Candidatus Vicinibacter affinis]
MIVFRIFKESLRQAEQQLVSNKLRSFLTLLGITIGIFCVIAVLSAVDSLEDNLVESFEKFGNDVLYIDKSPWTEDPGMNYWKYMSRPSPDLEDLRAIQRKSKMAQYASLSVFLPSSQIKTGKSYVEGAYFAGITEDYDRVIKMEFEDGRYFSSAEFQNGSDQIIVGSKLAAALFPRGDAVGKEVKAMGRKFNIVGILKVEGASLINIMPVDQAAFFPFKTMRKLININSNSSWGTMLNVKAKKGEDLEEMKYELASIIRPVRGLKPIDPDNFAINQVTMLTAIIDKVFSVLNIAGFVIGLFAMLVGAFGVANIMFVSVKERTPLIGIKMALGAKRFFILLEYLLEAIILCLVGGIAGLVMVWGILLLFSKVLHFDMYISMTNILIGLILSIIIGIVSGIIPALHASRMDPVEAMRR